MNNVNIARLSSKTNTHRAFNFSKRKLRPANVPTIVICASAAFKKYIDIPGSPARGLSNKQNSQLTLPFLSSSCLL
jgi:hypothetical protein